jgi:surface polysaccharide O-acyltransferase-like enzyme
MTDTRVLGSSDSDAIKIARVLCILCVVYMHMPPHHAQFATGTVAYNDYLWVIREAIGRTSVPLLSVISGYFVAKMLSQGPWRKVIGKKVFTLIIPLILWNAIALTRSVVENDPGFVFNLFNMHNYIIGVTEPPAMWVLYFLRDMFVCSLFAPLLIWLGQRAALITATGLIAVAVTGIDGPVFNNNMIPIFFFVGLLVFSGKLKRESLLREKPLYGVFAAVIAVGLSILPMGVFMWGDPEWLSASNSVRILLIRIAGTVAFWIAALSLTGTLTGKRLIRLEPVIFFVFCMHTLIIDIIWRLMDRLGLNENPAIVIGYFLSGPLVVLAMTLPFVWIGTRLMPVDMHWLGGGRIPSAQQWRAIFGSRTPGRRLLVKASPYGGK